MNQRFLVYPLLFFSLVQLAALLRGDRRWNAAQIAQSSLIVIASLGAIYFGNECVWVVIAWSLCVAFVLAPRSLVALAKRCERAARWRLAARLWQWAGRLVWGRLGRLFRGHARALRCVARGQWADAEAVLDSLAMQPLPSAARGVVGVWKLALLAVREDWEGALATYESHAEWGTLYAAMQARLYAARAYAETGQVERAQRCLQFVALSPRPLSAMTAQWLGARLAIAAAAGDREELERLLRGKQGKFAEHWRNRCAAGPPSESYLIGKEILREAERQSAHWHALMQFGRPAAATLGVLALLALVFVYTNMVATQRIQEKLWLWAANAPETVARGEWWRLGTALLLHANLLHLAMNGIALWMFGSAIEKTMGAWRFAAIFLLAGVAGNFASAWAAHYDLAVGASGGVFGLVGAFAVAVYRLHAPQYWAVRRRLLMFLTLMVAGDFTIGWLEPQVDNLAHVGGFAMGALLAWGLAPRRDTKR